ncbi:2,3-dihydro-2,3-dihydroxybenzoate dehydrogenase [Acrocarpospora pleiomorpha]|uniref:2,3-dihydro-2,3-dihydroxybenzoate dehydrogenase n=1 Tax=Acrocarpospora pleiomorpha TaxID=90975 RepID=A0A5M3XK86_9ACTN|nr:2,3-dihydro-2,3-dihydroxybenzoate dehydrogenase [Acrocarpospora pleiomorpha]GES21664.1 2,3-dihydro-2,3-dihydroxybenzoate dehydrogenase [Acrocarpospora pleiomorpha]
MNRDLTGEVALVTGAARGIGAAVAAALAGEGAVVAATDVLLGRTEGDIMHLTCDVTDANQVEALVGRVEREIGPIGILVNTAGVLRTGPAAELTADDWRAVFRVNTEGVFHVSSAVARRMIPRRRGRIVTVASNAGGIPRMGMSAYAASKAAAAMFTRCLGLELAAHGIRCNVVSPGSTDTAMQAGLDREAVLRGDLASFRTGIPLGRIADPADIADAVAFLVSDRARHITMQDLYVDGGATLRA